jgi:hypothetical protein
MEGCKAARQVALVRRWMPKLASLSRAVTNINQQLTLAASQWLKQKRRELLGVYLQSNIEIFNV